jgi:hypothetical protein
VEYEVGGARIRAAMETRRNLFLNRPALPPPRPAQSHQRLPLEAVVLKRSGREREEAGWVRERGD